MKRIAGAMPAASCEVDFFLFNQTLNRPDVLKQLRLLSGPANISTGKGLGNHRHVFFPFCVEGTALFPPLDMPVPITGKYEKTKNSND